MQTGSCSATLALPEVSHGLRYIVPTGTTNSEIHIVSMDATNVITGIFKGTAAITWQGKAGAVSAQPGSAFSIDMATHGTFISVSTSGDLTGTLIEGTTPITVHTGFSKTVLGSTTSTFADTGDEQIAPTTAWGKLHLVPGLPGRHYIVT